MKRIVVLVLVFSMILLVSVPTLAGEETLRLSDLSEEECVVFIKEHNVSIPQAFNDDIICGTCVRMIIKQVEDNPNVLFAFGSANLLKFATDIKAVVNQYYGTNAIATCDYMCSIFNILEDNTVYGTWKSEYEDYNGYAYALGEADEVDPGFSVWVRNGGNKSEYDFDFYQDILTIANLIRMDLEYYGYTVVGPSLTKPNVVIDDHTHLICVRKNTDGIQLPSGSSDYQGICPDYHIMKLGTNGKWYHKPGQTNPLQYKYTPSNSIDWICETYGGSWYCRYEDWTYESEIYYIKYTTPHDYEYVYCGSEQHIRTCTICGGTSGSASSCIYINNYCKSCGHYNGYTQITPNKRPGTETAVTE